ncbi:MAG TPA: hypothetical protein VFB27_07015 [Opitutaceae bacterium]|nr:hypothetical protein [Opitutaceae bacterium]
MQSFSTETRRFEFYFPDLDTLVLVEESDGEVVIRASRDTFSEKRKRYFIRELAAEGFIPDSYEWFSLAQPGGFHGVRWLIDFSWVKLPPAIITRARNAMFRIFSGAALLWLVLMTFVFTR